MNIENIFKDMTPEELSAAMEKLAQAEVEFSQEDDEDLDEEAHRMKVFAEQEYAEHLTANAENTLQ